MLESSHCVDGMRSLSLDEHFKELVLSIQVLDIHCLVSELLVKEEILRKVLIFEREIQFCYCFVPGQQQLQLSFCSLQFFLFGSCQLHRALQLLKLSIIRSFWHHSLILVFSVATRAPI